LNVVLRNSIQEAHSDPLSFFFGKKVSIFSTENVLEFSMEEEMVIINASPPLATELHAKEVPLVTVCLGSRGGKTIPVTLNRKIEQWSHPMPGIWARGSCKICSAELLRNMPPKGMHYVEHPFETLRKWFHDDFKCPFCSAFNSSPSEVELIANRCEIVDSALQYDDGSPVILNVIANGAISLSKSNSGESKLLKQNACFTVQAHSTLGCPDFNGAVADCFSPWEFGYRNKTMVLLEMGRDISSSIEGGPAKKSWSLLHALAWGGRWKLL
jgi:hypothetical protein